jgi:UDP-glucuronate 4-epimerase
MSILVTGSAGFIGSHLCAALERSGRRPLGLDRALPEEDASDRGGPRPAARGHETIRADLREPAALAPLAARRPFPIVAHLAAEAEVVIPFAAAGDVVGSNVAGTINLLGAAEPRLVVFTSTSAVYGNGRTRGAAPGRGETRPIGLYGMSKACAEIVGRDWARERGGAFVSVRLGNVVGTGCRGLIPYLVRHALRFPGGERPAELRGAGRLLRDYVPVEYVVALLLAAMDRRWPDGAAPLLNAGCGRGLTNADVTTVVARVLRGRGLELRPDFDHPIAPGEAERIVLGMTTTVRALGLAPPAADDVVASIEAATIDHLERASAAAVH